MVRPILAFLIGLLLAAGKRLRPRKVVQMKGVIFENVAYWQDQDKDWFKAPAIDGNIMLDRAIQIDIDNADPSEVYLLLKILEATNESDDSGQ